MDGTVAPLVATAVAAVPPSHLVPSHLTEGSVASGRYRVRAAEPDDRRLIREFVCGLSVRTQYFRFFTAVAPPSAGLLRALSGGSGRADILLVTDDSGAVVGHGMAADGQVGGTHAADIGLVVADSWQGQGLGTTLLRLLTDRAAERGVKALVLEVLPDNRRMLGIIERRWPHARRERTLDSIRITAGLVRPDAVSAILPGPLLAAQLRDCAARGASYQGAA
jgi:ribosomal protein S18 acetylase RimI-like enzyme